MTRTVLLVRSNGETLTDEVPLDLDLSEIVQESEVQTGSVTIRYFRRMTPPDQDIVIYEQYDSKIVRMNTAALIQRIKDLSN